jgi:hypothetical protein
MRLPWVSRRTHEAALSSEIERSERYRAAPRLVDAALFRDLSLDGGGRQWLPIRKIDPELVRDVRRALA